MKALELIHLRTAGVVQACQHFYHLQTNNNIYLNTIKITAELMWSCI